MYQKICKLFKLLLWGNLNPEDYVKKECYWTWDEHGAGYMKCDSEDAYRRHFSKQYDGINQLKLLQEQSGNGKIDFL